jgi:pimeloyl-ACP methyl ester carboxylesterase
MQVLLLPGLDGTGSLFGPFVRALPSWCEPVVARYDRRQASYAALLDRLPLPRGEFAIVAESFSGPLGVMLAARQASVRALLLVATFVRNPSPLTRFAPLTRVLPRPPATLLRALLTGGAPVTGLAEAIATLPASTLAGRLEALRDCDVRDALRATRVPTLLVRPGRDRLIPARAFAEVRACGVRERVVPGAPHLVLQTEPAACAEALAELCRR